MAIWAVILGIMLITELVAILTKERYFPTLSRTTWRLLGLEDNSYDRKEKIVRIIFGIVFGIFLIWVWIHLVLGPCAFGIC